MPKITLNTTIWEETDLEKWQNKLIKHNLLLTIFFIGNFLYGIRKHDLFMLILNAFPIFIYITMTLSHKKYTTKKREEQEQCDVQNAQKQQNTPTPKTE